MPCFIQKEAQDYRVLYYFHIQKEIFIVKQRSFYCPVL